MYIIVFPSLPHLPPSLPPIAQGTHISPSPSPDLTDDGRIGTLRRESKEEGHVFNVTFIKGMTSFGLTPVPIGDAEGGDAEEGDGTRHL